MNVLTSAVRRTATAIRAFVARDDITHAASLAFYTSLSFGPIVILMLTASGAVGTEVQLRFIGQAADLVGPEAARVMQVIVENAEQLPSNNLGQLLTWVVLIFSATGVFAELQYTLNLIWEVQPSEGRGLWRWARKRLLSFGILFAIGFILSVTLVVHVLVTAMIPADGVLWSVVNALFSLGVSTLLFGLIYWFVPDAKVPGRCVWAGAFGAAVLFSISKYAIGVYLGNNAAANAYGAASAVIVLLMWAYVSCIIFVFGAEITRASTLAALDHMPAPERAIAERDEDAAIPDDTH